MMDKLKVIRRVDDTVNEVASRLGFQEEYRSLNYNWGFDRIVTSQINVFERTMSFQIVISLSRRINLLETLWEEYSELLALQKENNITFNLTALYCFPELINQSYNHEGTGWMTFSTDENGLREFEEVVEFILKEKILPKAEELMDIRKLDQLINDKIEVNEDLTSYIFNSNGLVFRRIALAKISKNPLFGKICDYYRSNFDKYLRLSNNPGYEHFANIPEIFEKVYKKLGDFNEV